VRPVQAGADLQEECAGCGELVVFLAKIPSRLRRQVITNVYEDGKWVKVEHWHLVCYVAEDMPYGRPKELERADVRDIETLWDQLPVGSDHRAVIDALVRLYRNRRQELFAGP
jgi:hypothetical protein